MVAKESDRTYQLNNDKNKVVFFAAQKLLSLIRSYLFLFPFLLEVGQQDLAVTYVKGDMTQQSYY